MMVRILHGVLIAVVLAVSLVVAPTPVSAATITVGENGCTLHDAILAANTDAAVGDCDPGSGADTIVLEAGEVYLLSVPVYVDDWNGTSGLPIVTSDITIEGNGATIARDPSAPEFRLLLQQAGSLTLNNLTLRGGFASGAAGSWAEWGGCVLSMLDGAALQVTDSTFTECSADVDGGALAAGSADITGSSFYGNTARDGALRPLEFEGSQFQVTNSTIVNNTAYAIFAYLMPVEVNGVTIAGNTRGSYYGGSSSLDARNSILSPAPVGPGLDFNDLGGNLVGVDPQLGELQDNGGPTLTRKPLPGSPAIGNGDVATCLPIDQRGTPRNLAVKCDSGAVEDTTPVLTLPADITVNATSPAGAVVTFDVTATDIAGNLLVVTCNAGSGDLFPVGSTTVSCSAIDGFDQTTGAFTITVIGAGDLLDDLYTLVAQTPIAGPTSTADSIRRTMLTMVVLADGFEASGADSAACLMLTRLELEVRTQVSKRRITTRDAQVLWTKIDEVQAAIGCGGLPG